MTKVMFQVGLLGFFISALYFGMQGMPLMAMVLRAFIVFIAVVLGQAILFVMMASMKKPVKPAPEKPQAERRAPPPAEPQAQQATTH